MFYSWEETILILQKYQLPVVFFGAFFFGETVIISASLLAGQGVWSAFNVFWIALLGTIVADVIWFWLGEYIFQKKRLFAKYEHQYGKLLKFLERYTGHRPFLVLLFIKFLYGMRILTIVYLSIRKIKMSLFVIFDVIGTSIYLVALIAIGWTAGKGTVNLIPYLNKFQSSLIIIIIVLIGVKIFTTWLTKEVAKQ